MNKGAMMMSKLGFSAAAMMVLATGCAIYPQTNSVGDEREDTVFSEVAFESQSDYVREGAVYTSLGGFSVHGPAQVVRFEGDREELELEVARNEADSAMAMVGIVNLGHPAFSEVGRTTLFREGEMVGNVEDDHVGLTLTACAGPDYGVWDADVPVDEVLVKVEESDVGEIVLVLESDEMNVELVLQ